MDGREAFLEGTPGQVDDIAGTEVLVRQQLVDLIGVALPPPPRIEAEEPPHGIARRRRPVATTACMASSWLRRAAAPAALTR